ncbi:MAG: hypothetical protein ACREQI_03240 [Candidatus Binataceae bacterium]
MRDLELKTFRDPFEHLLQTVQHLFVPKAQYPVAPILKPRGAAAVGPLHRLLAMLAAVEFDYQARFKAEEIGDLRWDRMLAAELRSLELAVAQVRP